MWATEAEISLNVTVDQPSTTERTERALAFLDTWSVVSHDGLIKTKVVRKATHTETDI